MIFFSVRLQEKRKKKRIREKNIMILQLVTNAYQINVVERKWQKKEILQ